MTYEEARKVLVNTYFQFGRRNAKTVFYDALNVAGGAINKQIPQKPIKSVHYYREETTKEEAKFNLTHCPCCWYNKEIGYLDNLIDKDKKYCHRCGQAIDWSE